MIRNETTVEARKKTTWFMMSSLQALWNFPEDRRAPVKVEVGPCGMAERKEKNKCVGKRRREKRTTGWGDDLWIITAVPAPVCLWGWLLIICPPPGAHLSCPSAYLVSLGTLSNLPSAMITFEGGRHNCSFYPNNMDETECKFCIWHILIGKSKVAHKTAPNRDQTQHVGRLPGNTIKQ